MRSLLVVLCLVLLAPALLNPVHAGQEAGQLGGQKNGQEAGQLAGQKREQKPTLGKKAKRGEKATRGKKASRVEKARQKATAQAIQDLLKPRLSQSELRAPYSAMSREHMGPASADGGPGAQRPDLEDSWQSNATSWKVDLSLDPKRQGKGQDDDGPLRFRLGRETVIDPLTKEERTPRADPLKARQSLEDLNLKGALDNLGGKAEVQVDVLKF